MEMTEKTARELKKRIESEQHRHEAEVLEIWKNEVDTIYRKKHESLASMQVDLKRLMERMNNRIIMLRRQAKDSL